MGCCSSDTPLHPEDVNPKHQLPTDVFKAWRKGRLPQRKPALVVILVVVLNSMEITTVPMVFLHIVESPRQSIYIDWRFGFCMSQTFRGGRRLQFAATVSTRTHTHNVLMSLQQPWGDWLLFFVLVMEME